MQQHKQRKEEKKENKVAEEEGGVPWVRGVLFRNLLG